MAISGARDDLDFMPDVAAAARRGGNRFAFFLTLLTLAFFAAFLAWANYAVLDEVTRGDARVVPSSRVQVVQNLEGGILSAILVREGQVVGKGDVLVRIDNTVAEATFRETKSRYLALLAVVARLEAEVEDRAIEFPKDVLAQAPAAAAGQQALRRARKQQIQAELTILEAQAMQRRQEIVELKTRRATTGKTLSITREERKITGPLVKSGVMSRVTLLRLDREISALAGELEIVRQSIPRAESALKEAEERIHATVLSYRTAALADLNRQRTELQPLVETMKAGEDRVIRTEVRSPVRGTIKDIKQNTIGGIIQPGEDILEVVPLDDTLLIEARIRPADIAFLRPQQRATVKITAYDFSIYGGLKARVERISADTIQDERGDRFYRVLLRTDDNALSYQGRELPIIAGMTATVEVLTGSKTVLDYLLKPLLKARNRALRER